VVDLIYRIKESTTSITTTTIIADSFISNGATSTSSNTVVSNTYLMTTRLGAALMQAIATATSASQSHLIFEGPLRRLVLLGADASKKVMGHEGEINIFMHCIVSGASFGLLQLMLATPSQDADNLSRVSLTETRYRLDTPLMWAIHIGKDDQVLDLLIQHSTLKALNFQRRGGSNTALHMAAVRSMSLTVARLLEAGANPRLVNISNKTPFDVAFHVLHQFSCRQWSDFNEDNLHAIMAALSAVTGESFKSKSDFYAANPYSV